MRAHVLGAAALGVLCAAIARPACAQANNAGASFLLAPIGARLTALGSAGAGDVSAVGALFTNPAAFARLTHTDASLDLGIDDLTQRAVAVVGYPAGVVGNFAGGVYLQNIDRQARTTSQGDEIGTFFFRNLAYSASYAARFGGGLSAGVTFKYIQFRADCTGNCDPIPGEPTLPPTVSSTSAVDVGAQFDVPKSPLHLGIALRNAGLRLQVIDAEQADPLPTQLVAGAAYDVPHMERYVRDATLRVVADAATGLGKETVERSLHVGAEASYQRAFFLRAGYSFRTGDYAGATVGFGLARQRFALDVARQLGVGGVLANRPPTYVGLRYGF